MADGLVSGKRVTEDYVYGGSSPSPPITIGGGLMSLSILVCCFGLFLFVVSGLSGADITPKTKDGFELFVAGIMIVVIGCLLDTICCV